MVVLDQSQRDKGSLSHRNENVLSGVATNVAFRGKVVGTQSSDQQAGGIRGSPLTFSKTSSQSWLA